MLNKDKIEAIIKAKLREEGLNEDAFTIEEIIEDVINDFSNSAYLDFDQRDELYERINSLNSLVNFENGKEVIQKLPSGKQKDQLSKIVKSENLSPRQLSAIEEIGKRKWKAEFSFNQRESRSNKLFRNTSIILFTIIVLFGLFAVPYLLGKNIYEIDRDNTSFDILVVLIGVLVTLISISISRLLVRKKRRSINKEDIEDIEFEEVEE